MSFSKDFCGQPGLEDEAAAPGASMALGKGDISDPKDGKQLDPVDPSGIRRRRERRSEPTERGELIRQGGASCDRVREECYSGFLIVRLADKLVLRDDRFPELIKKRREKDRGKHQEPSPYVSVEPPANDDVKDPDLLCLERWWGECPPTRLVQAVRPAAIRRLEELARETALPPLRSLASYWRLDARHLAERTVRRFVRLLNEFVEIDLAYRERAALDPQDPPCFVGLQQYLDQAPLGVGVRGGRWPRGRFKNTDASAILVDLEQGWLRSHVDLEPPQPFYGDNRDGNSPGYRGDHGTAVLGQLVAFDDDRGVVGVAPGFTIRQVSHYHRTRLAADGREIEEASNGHVADAIVAAIVELGFAPGVARRLKNRAELRDLRLRRQDLAEIPFVLLIEVQRGFWPIEVDPADFDALRLASALRTVVVEAAGNGGEDLDRYRDEQGRRILRRASRDFLDSGAIVVGAAESELPHDRADFSNFGSRVDVYSLGDHVVTCGYGDLLNDGPEKTYTAFFGGTSSAAPVIAGTAALLQDLHVRRAGGPLGRAELRQILADPRTGTPQGPGVPGRIGVMPDLRAITRALGLVPVLTSALGGGEDSDLHDRKPSPQIIVRRNRVSVTLRNQGLAPEDPRSSVRVFLFLNELSTLPALGAAALIDKDPSPVPIPPPGRSLDLGPFDINPPLAEDEGVFALLQQEGEPAPVLPPGAPFFHLQAYLSFLKDHPSHLILKRKAGGTAASPLELPFFIKGMPDSPRLFDFEILQRVPGGKIVFQVPSALVGPLEAGGLGVAGDDGRFSLPRRHRISLSSLRLSAGGAYPSRFLIEGARAGQLIALRQFFAGAEVGRITWKFES